MRKLSVLALPVLLLTACAGVPRLSAIHDPLYRAQNHTSTITARATETRDGIASIRIDAVVGELTACTGAVGALPSLIPCRAGASSVSAICSLPTSRPKSRVRCRSTSRPAG